MNLFTKSAYKTDAHTLKQIKAWIYHKLEIDTQIAISINQLQCHEPGCPPLETFIAVMTSPSEQYKIHKPLSQIAEADIITLKKSGSSSL
ncbi:hypothetical protein [Myxosarcina sp. GI1(2024)]